MSKVHDIEQALKARGYTFIPRVTLDESARSVFIHISLDSLSDKVHGGKTSWRQLSYVKTYLRSLFDIDVIPVFFVSGALEGIEPGLQAVLVSKYPDYITGIYISYRDRNHASVWLVSKCTESADIKAKIQEQVIDYLSNVDVNVEGLEFLGCNKPQVTLAALLRAIKLLAPVSIPLMAEYLRSVGFNGTSELDLARQLDGVRKKGFVLRDQQERYTLTTDGVGAVPHTRSRSSSDVQRMLLLARRRGW